MGERRKSREMLLQLLFQAELNSEKDPKTLLSRFWEKDERAEALFISIWEKRNELDHVIEEVSENWKMDRMSHVDRNILRYASYELLYCSDVPGEVVMNEAIEIAKRYGTENSSSFVNGILDKIWKSRSSNTL
ncbi:MAG: transcription antitermination factor NusB [Deltaproteobacteria bacterium GWA2_38_16]|nr:MAG: transcription antitermination factor NusB [Deltaproteobacteria bacterium GWA2_38_16]OGQ02564.1 MAG: transcription antitermination factor NusB [Deltaproteobacteria bacterium RIFCSPHIGHO2_02_FULL_38_15]OGQ30599.1 MAG: transcription antitermination factor NusB [Deltaproteobacteria bacterium RIFCSPLOWO2_01_FULL_38_9]OGQ60392.1 MAG: transcription antitermination factor NusB [Deltaproteobacteria bacterium RIFCSPLOWO2_12_FULL_38_8]HBQ20981.1 transcription antitermination factor NusB [Deltaprot